VDYSTVDTTARVREWQYLTGADFDAMDRKKTVVTVSCSPLEVHGPHLPVITDNLEAEGLLLRSMELLCERHDDIQFVHLPPLYCAADVLPHHGSVMFRSSTIQRTIEDLGRSLGRQGFEHVWVGSFHGGPRHFVSIEAGCERANARWGTKMVSVFSLLVGELTGGTNDLKGVLADRLAIAEDELAGDTHGGTVETSLMLHFLGKYVDESYAKLPRVTVEQKLRERGERPLSMEGVRELFRTFREKIKFFEDETYAGAPHLASPERGEAIADLLAKHSADALEELWLGERDPGDCHSPLWRYRWLFLVEAVGQAFEKVIRYRTPVW